MLWPCTSWGVPILDVPDAQDIPGVNMVYPFCNMTQSVALSNDVYVSFYFLEYLAFCDIVIASCADVPLNTIQINTQTTVIQ